MRFTRELPANVNLIRSHSASDLRVGERVLTRSCLLSATDLIDNWSPRTIADLSIDDFTAALEWQPEIILLGTGTRQQFPAHTIHAFILSRGIGFEVMDTGAASRTFNVLVGENRRVAAGFLL